MTYPYLRKGNEGRTGERGWVVIIEYLGPEFDSGKVTRGTEIDLKKKIKRKDVLKSSWDQVPL